MEYTKARMLKYLNENIKELHIMHIYILQSEAYFNDKSGEIEKILNVFNDTEMIVRSSSKQEDTLRISNAGKFESVLHVAPKYQELQEAIEKVYNSYQTKENEEILIQPMVKNVIKAGVIFTQDIETFADYYTVNYQEGNNTEAVTSGSTNNLKTFVAYKNSEIVIDDKDMNKLIISCKKIEQFLQNGALDIEFVIDQEHNIYILQVRPIATGNKIPYENIDLKIPLNRIYKKVEKLAKPHPFLLGKSTCFGVMPDWNPAEILGVRPKKMAISLYKELVTDNVWAHQREKYGYRDLTMHPLMVSFCGIPYIDTRITFNSFIPKDLNTTIADKLVNYYLDRLAEYPTYHDKIEFEIVFSCYYFGISKKLNQLLKYGFNENEIKRIEFTLLELTNKVIHPQTGLYKKDLDKVEVLETNYNKIVESDISTVDKIYWLIEECKEYGTLPFAGVARAAFIAVQLLRSFVDNEILTKEDYDAYLNSLNTVNRQLSKDLEKLNNKVLSIEKFLERYGHIRPGTYDILSQRYDENFEGYFYNTKPITIKEQDEIDFKLSNNALNKIQLELEQNGFIVNVNELFAFIKEAIEGREYLKFIFTRAVSKILQLIEDLGARADIGKEEMAHLDISVIKQLYVDLYYGDISNIFRENINRNKAQYECAKQIKLPSIITESKDIYYYYLLNEEPNFVTQKTITAEVVTEKNIGLGVTGKIVFIQSADPGYDYLFSKKIGGLVTRFGGANSHMTIRCAELGIPAVIGAGENNYFNWQKNSIIEINCLKKQVLPIH